MDDSRIQSTTGLARGPDVMGSLRAERGVRTLLMIILTLGMCGIAADLLLLDHVEDTLQLIPLALLALAALLLVVHGWARSSTSVRLIQVAMVLFVVCGGFGMYLHFEGNAEFQREIDPDLTQSELVWKALRAKAPPALAPMAFVQLGLVGMAWSFRHPRLRSGQPSS